MNRLLLKDLQNRCIVIDTVKLHIPIFPTYVKSYEHKNGVVYETTLSINELGLTGSSRCVKDGVAFEIYHAYDSLPTSHSGIGYKFYHCSNNELPHLALNCSIAKILQGHNVYGHDNLLNCIQMLGAIKETFPTLWQYLDVQNTKVVYIDITYSAVMQNLKQAEQVRDYLRNVDFKGLRNQSVIGEKDHYNTVYFGSENSRIGRFKVYCKGIELEKERNVLERLAKQNDLSSQRKLQTIFTTELQDYADKLVRIEATIKTRQMQAFGIPQNLWQLYDYHIKNPTFFTELWQMKTKAMFTALQGKTMNYADDSEIWQVLESQLTTYTKTGRESKTKARNAYNFYKRIQQSGFYQVKQDYKGAERTFQMNVKSLLDCGISKAFLQNLHATKDNTINILEVLTVDFNNQIPTDVVIPTPNGEYLEVFKPYFMHVVNTRLQKVENELFYQSA